MPDIVRAISMMYLFEVANDANAGNKLVDHNAVATLKAFMPSINLNIPPMTSLRNPPTTNFKPL